GEFALCAVYRSLLARLYELHEERVWTIRAAAQFRVELHANEERVIRVLHDLGEVAVWVHTGNRQSSRFQLLQVLAVDFPAVTVALMNGAAVIGALGGAAVPQLALPETQAHGAAHVDILLIRHDIDHRMRSAVIDFGCIGILEAEQ